MSKESVEKKLKWLWARRAKWENLSPEDLDSAGAEPMADLINSMKAAGLYAPSTLDYDIHTTILRRLADLCGVKVEDVRKNGTKIYGKRFPKIYHGLTAGSGRPRGKEEA